MHRMSELVRLKNGNDAVKYLEAVKADVDEMVEVLGYDREEARRMTLRQIEFHASFQREGA